MSMLARARSFMAKFFLFLTSWRAQIRVQQQSAIEGGSRAPDCPLNRVSSYIYVHLLHVSVTSTLHALLLVVPNCLSAHADTIYVDVSVSNTSRALVLVGIAPLYGCGYVHHHINPS